MKVVWYDKREKRHRDAGECMICNKGMSRREGVIILGRDLDLAYCATCVRALAAALPTGGGETKGDGR